MQKVIDKIEGFLEVGRTDDTHEVVINQAIALLRNYWRWRMSGVPSNSRGKAQQVTVTLECVGCKDRKDIDPRTGTEQPMCDKCYMPMVVIRAKVVQGSRGKARGQR